LSDRFTRANLDDAILGGEAVTKELELVATEGQIGEVAMPGDVSRELLQVVRTGERTGSPEACSRGIFHLEVDTANTLSAAEAGREHQE